MHFPKGEKYVSLLKSSDDPVAQAAIVAERARLRAMVHKQLADIALVTEADEGAGLLARQLHAAQQETAFGVEVRQVRPVCAFHEAGQRAMPWSAILPSSRN
jgi:hypothetical protein